MALIQNYLDTARMEARGSFAARFGATAKSYLSRSRVDGITSARNERSDNYDVASRKFHDVTTRDDASATRIGL